MKIVRHNGNKPFQLIGDATPFVEVDVHINESNMIEVKHDPNGKGLKLGEYLYKTPRRIEGFLVNIKQNLHIKQLWRIRNAFDTRFMGFIDVPWPSCHQALKEFPEFVYGRVSEYEPVLSSYERIWLDPLDSWDLDSYLIHAEETDARQKIMVACPSLHGQKKSMDIEVIKGLLEEDEFYQIEGCVTKYPKEILEVLRNVPGRL